MDTSLSSRYKSSPSQLHGVKTCNISNHRHRSHLGKLADPHAAASSTTGISKEGLSFRNDVSNIVTVVQQTITEISKLSEEDEECP
jgi:hypothetical protein